MVRWFDGMIGLRRKPCLINTKNCTKIQWSFGILLRCIECTRCINVVGLVC